MSQLKIQRDLILGPGYLQLFVAHGHPQRQGQGSQCRGGHVRHPNRGVHGTEVHGGGAVDPHISCQVLAAEQRRDGLRRKLCTHLAVRGEPNWLAGAHSELQLA